jgi:hypothetical protein
MAGKEARTKIRLFEQSSELVSAITTEGNSLLLSFSSLRKPKK